MLQRRTSRPIVTWLPEAGPRTLAAVRIASGLAVILFVAHRVNFVLPPESLWFPQPGTAWLSFLPANDILHRGGLAIAALSAIGVTVGWHTRWAAWSTLAAVFYTGWVTTLTGKVDHNHHLIWVLAVLAVSPCANAWALRRENRAGSYRWPIAAVMVMIGLIYFGAGLQKISSAGLAWGWSDNLTNTMLNMAWEKKQPIVSWLVDWPVAGRVLGLGALAFELFFLPLILYPPSRRLVWPAGLLFHGGTWLILGISFLSLVLLYVAFIPWDRLSENVPPTSTQRRLLVGLISAILVFAIAGNDLAWPIAAYPGFGGIQEARIVDVEVISDDGTKFVTETFQASQVGRQRMLPLVSSAIYANKHEELATWLGADVLTRVVIDTSSGTVVERHQLFP